jgi:hypothetical protein
VLAVGEPGSDNELDGMDLAIVMGLDAALFGSDPDTAYLAMGAVTADGTVIHAEVDFLGRFGGATASCLAVGGKSMETLRDLYQNLVVVGHPQLIDDLKRGTLKGVEVRGLRACFGSLCLRCLWPCHI